MNDPALDPSTETGKAARATIIALAGAQGLFWIYTIYYIISHANPKGDGFELVAIMPMSIIFIMLVLPALMMGLNKRETLRIPTILCLLGLVANFIVWGWIVAEFAQSAAR